MAAAERTAAAPGNGLCCLYFAMGRRRSLGAIAVCNGPHTQCAARGRFVFEEREIDDGEREN